MRGLFVENKADGVLGRTCLVTVLNEGADERRSCAIVDDITEGVGDARDEWKVGTTVPNGTDELRTTGASGDRTKVVYKSIQDCYKV